MGEEYIDREKAMEIVKRTSGDYAAAWSEIRQLPAADVSPVVHGEWIELLRSSFDSTISTQCSCCNEEYTYKQGKLEHIGWEYPKYNYCPNCGAKMDGVK